ncbi:MAG: DUF3039 domain-containing protein [Candidatus Ancillula trichonymphae]|nr:DUF3039 domain-containing protein [Candidatus Ancillula trichonymphae]
MKSLEHEGETAGGVWILENPEVGVNENLGDSDDDERYAHWVDAEKAEKAKITGGKVIALCGKVWTPTRDPDNYPICPRCQELYEKMNKGTFWF